MQFKLLTFIQVPDSQDLASASTYPGNFVSAYYLLFVKLGLPVPSEFPASTPPPDAASPILLYGGGSTAAQYVLQLLKLAGYTNILVTASKKHHAYLSELGATKSFDYASPTMVEDIRETAGGAVPIAIDIISTFGTLGAIAKVIEPKGKLAVLLPVKGGERLLDGELLWEIPKESSPFGPDVELLYVGTMAFMMQVSSCSVSSGKSLPIQQNPQRFVHIMSTVLPGLLASGSLKPNKIVLLDEKFGGLKGRYEEGLTRMKANGVSGEKMVVKINH